MKKVQLFTLATLFAGCGGKTSSGNGVVSSSSGLTENHEPVEITYASWDLGSADSEVPNLDRMMIEEFQKEYPWITVKILDRPKQQGTDADQDWAEFLTSRAAVKRLPDVFKTEDIICLQKEKGGNFFFEAPPFEKDFYSSGAWISTRWAMAGMLSFCISVVGLINAPVARNNTLSHSLARIRGRISPQSTTAEQPHPLPPAWVSWVSGSKMILPQSSYSFPSAIPSFSINRQRRSAPS